MESITINGCSIELAQGDITTEETDAIVNAANSHLAGGGGVDGAIHRAAGPAIMEETRKRYPDGCPTGSAVISSGGNLPARHVIHAVGPRWRGGDRGEAEQLAGAYRTSLQLAQEHRCDEIAFPAISAGIYGYPLEQAAAIAVETAADFLRHHAAPKRVRFVLFSDDVYRAFANALKKV